MNELSRREEARRWDDGGSVSMALYLTTSECNRSVL